MQADMSICLLARSICCRVPQASSRAPLSLAQRDRAGVSRAEDLVAAVHQRRSGSSLACVTLTVTYTSRSLPSGGTDSGRFANDGEQKYAINAELQSINKELCMTTSRRAR